MNAIPLTNSHNISLALCDSVSHTLNNSTKIYSPVLSVVENLCDIHRIYYIDFKDIQSENPFNARIYSFLLNIYFSHISSLHFSLLKWIFSSQLISRVFLFKGIRIVFEVLFFCKHCTKFFDFTFISIVLRFCVYPLHIFYWHFIQLSSCRFCNWIQFSEPFLFQNWKLRNILKNRFHNRIQFNYIFSDLFICGLSLDHYLPEFSQ